jgi:hypothetical protein
MATAATITAKLKLDSADFNDGVEKAKQKAGSLSGKLDKAGKSMMKAGGIATAGLTVPIVAGLGMATNAASDLEEATNAMNVVFGDASGILEDYSQTVGLAQSEFKQLGAVTGSFLQNLGFDADQAAQETIKLTERAADMASVFNTDVDQALEAIQSGLKGEFNPLENFGVKMNAAAIEAKALEMGLVPVIKNETKIREAQLKAAQAQEKLNAVRSDEEATALDLEAAEFGLLKAQEKLSEAMEGSVGEIDDNMKATAALALVMEQTDRIAGDFQNTSDGLANKTRIVKAQFEDAKAALGEQLLPIMTQVVGVIGNLITKFTELTPAQQKTILIVLGIIAAIGPLITIIGALVTAVGFIASPIGLVFAAIAAVVALFVMAWKNNWGGIQDKMKAAWEFIKPILMNLWSWLKEKVPQAIEKLKTFWETVLLPAIKTAWEWIKTNVIPLWKDIARILGGVVKIAIIAIASLFKFVLIPAAKAVWKFIKEKVVPIIKDLWSWLSEKLSPAISSVQGFFQTLKDKIHDFANALGGLALPDWLTPGSPTPLETGLKGIHSAMSRLNSQSLPTLQAGLNLSTPSVLTPLAANAGGGAGGGQTIFQSGAIVVNDQATGEQVLKLLKGILNGEVR